MSRLDDHVAAVQNRLALELFNRALAWMGVVLASLVWVAVLVDRVFLKHPPRPILWLYGGAATAIVGALAYAIYRRPSAREAAVPIDQKLGLKEKISTALYLRSSQDLFAQAALKDAEETARNVALNVGQHFPLSFPKPAYAFIVIAIAAYLTYALIDPMNLFDRREKQAQVAAQQAEVDNAKKNVAKAIAFVDSVPQTVANEEAVQLAKAELAAMMQPTANDAGKINRTAVKALQDVNEAIKQQIKNGAKYAEAQNELKMMRSMQTPTEGQGPVSDAHHAIAEGKFSEAVQDLEKAVENFDKMDKADQQKAAQQMQQMAQQLQQMGNQNPAQQQQAQQQLQQMGMNQQQAKQAQQLMQQAAQGNQQAQQQLQQMAQQAQQQMNNGQGPNPQQQQQIQQMMQQMQAQANAQQQAQQMAQAAQQMAQGMQQQAQQNQQGQQAQQGQQQAQMGQGMQQMQQQLQQMQAQAQDAQQIAAAQAGAQAAQAAAQNAMNGQGGQGGRAGGQGQWNAPGNVQGNNPGNFGQNNGNGMQPNQGGQAAGDRSAKQSAPYTVKPEVSPSQDDEKGRILASTYIKDNSPLKGSSSAELKQVAERALNQETDEIDQERISRQAQNAVKAYFNSMTKDADTTAAPK